jgi:hypothetical protein
MRGDTLTMPEIPEYPFPVGDDPTDPEVLAYWKSVARRIALAPLPRDLRSWAEAIDDRITEFHAATAALDAAQEDDEAKRAAHRLASAVFEFKRIKWKLSAHFGREFDLSDPALVLLFSAPENSPGN